MKLLFFSVLKLSVLAIAIIAICGCGIDLDPCTYEVGDVIETTAFSGGYTKYVDLTISGCDDNVILKIIGDPIFREPGDTIKYKVVKVNSAHSYDVRVIG